MAKKWYRDQQKKKYEAPTITKLEAVKPAITINGKSLEDFSDDDLRATAVSAGFGVKSEISTLEIFDGKLIPITTSVTLATANRHQLVALLASTAPHKA